jgi:hypothetical protein
VPKGSVPFDLLSQERPNQNRRTCRATAFNFHFRGLIVAWSRSNQDLEKEILLPTYLSTYEI